MSIYIYSFIFNMILGIFILGNKPSKASSMSKIVYLTFTAIYFGLLCGFRDLSVGWDTNTYYNEFLFRLPNNLWELKTYNGRLEFGFVFLSFVVKLFGGGFQSLLIVTSLFIMGSTCCFIYRHSANVLLSIFILLCFPFYYSTFDIMRHFLATSFILLGYKYVLERSLFKYSIFVFFAFLFQKSSIVFLLLYLIPNIRFNKLTLVVSFVCTIVAYFSFDLIFSSQLFSFLGYNITVYGDWFNSDAGGNKTAIMYFVVFIISCVAYKNLKNKGAENETALLYILFLFLFSVIFTKNRMIIRFIMTFIAFLSISIPLLFNKVNVKSKHKVSLLLCTFIIIGLIFHSFMLLTSWQKVVPYVPYWESLNMYH